MIVYEFITSSATHILEEWNQIVQENENGSLINIYKIIYIYIYIYIYVYIYIYIYIYICIYIYIYIYIHIVYT